MINALYRGKRIDNGEWVQGWLKPYQNGGYDDIKEYPRLCIQNGSLSKDIYEVIPETVGQWTGMNDKNCIKIFEGDIIECDFYNAMVKMVKIEHRKHLIIFENGAFAIQWRIGNDKYSNYLYETWGRKIIGNFYDNPELLD